MSNIRDNEYHVFDLPPAHYVAGQIEVVEGNGGLSVWEVQADDEDMATRTRTWWSCAVQFTVSGEQIRTPGCR